MASLLSSVEGLSVVGFALLLALSLSCLLLLLSRRNGSGKLRLPPSPSPSWPLMGHLHIFAQIRRGSKILEDFRRALGPIVTLHLGNTPTIFVSSASVAHEALVLKGSLFATRPRQPSRALFTSNYRGISSSPYGAHWRTVRRNLVHNMLSPAKTLVFGPMRSAAISTLVSRLAIESQANCGIVDVRPNCRFAMFQLLLAMCLGLNLPDDAVLEVSNTIEKILPFSIGLLSDAYPFLRLYDRKNLKKARLVRQAQVDLFVSLIEQHKKMHKVGETIPGSYLETLLSMHEDANGQLDLSDTDLVTLCTEFLVGGIDTTVNCMEWTLAHFVQDPSIQDKLYKEIVQASENGKPIDETHLPRMPYLQAVVKETLRLNPPGHFTLPHAVSQQCKLAGYDIPSHAVVNFYIPAISRDPQTWEDPLEYRPERMLAREVDITGMKDVTMLPFGAGRRVCPGAGLALMHLELFIGRLVQEFEWNNAKPGEAVDMSEKTKFTVVMKRPLKARIQKRNGSIHG